MFSFQTLVLAVATFAEEEPENTPENFSTQLQEIGGFHRLIKLLPEVIADVTSSRRESAPLKPEERIRLVGVWTSITPLMARQFVYGWERRIVPKNSKFSEIYRGTPPCEMRTAAVFCLLFASTLQWAFNPADFSPNSGYIPDKRPTRTVIEEPQIGYIANPLARKWRKLRSRRDYSME